MRHSSVELEFLLPILSLPILAGSDRHIFYGRPYPQKDTAPQNTFVDLPEYSLTTYFRIYLCATGIRFSLTWCLLSVVRRRPITECLRFSVLFFSLLFSSGPR
jgi:hypothetical protein